MEIDLAPLRLGEILDRIFQLYRARFLLFLGIAAVAAAIELVGGGLNVAQTVILNSLHLFGSTRQAVSIVISIAAYALSFACGALTVAAMNRAIYAIYEGRSTGVANSYGELGGDWLRCVWTSVLAFFIAWGPVILVVAGGLFSVGLAKSATTRSQANALGAAFGGVALLVVIVFPFCVWMMVRYSLAIPACVQEKAGVLSSLKRSVDLSQETRGRIFVLFLIVGLAYYIVFLALFIPAFWTVLKRPDHHPSVFTNIWTLATSFLASSLLKPIYGIGLTLFYYDSRIRKEGFDVEWMLEHSESQTAPTTSEAGPAPGLILE